MRLVRAFDEMFQARPPRRRPKTKESCLSAGLRTHQVPMSVGEEKVASEGEVWV